MPPESTDDPMLAIAFFLMAILLGGAAFLFREAATQIYVGTPWAGEVCSTSQMFCHHPEYLAYGGEALLVIAIGTKLARLSNHGW